MKIKIKIIITFIITSLALSFSASAQKFGDDVIIYECIGSSVKYNISVAGNGWIYVMMYESNYPYQYGQTRIYRSIDGGINFQQIFSENNNNVAFDFVVTGNTESDIAIWYVYAENRKTPSSNTTVYLYKMDANGGNKTQMFEEYSSRCVTHDVSISTNARSPEGDWEPFTIGFVWSRNRIKGWPDYETFDEGYIGYVYSINGGVDFTYKTLYRDVTSKFGKIDLSIGQALASAWWPIGALYLKWTKIAVAMAASVFNLLEQMEKS